MKVDSSLDCERGIMRALTEFGQAATNVPLELLREWTLVAINRKDCGLLGRAMTLLVKRAWCTPFSLTLYTRTPLAPPQEA